MDPTAFTPPLIGYSASDTHPDILLPTLNNPTNDGNHSETDSWQQEQQDS